ncbi:MULTISPECIES: 2-amino-4-hydroxy-6-hydroxymethyldihydropteridine diphosphokinase [Psychrobacter]|uniref:2-amino-4-hydroxy-6- hydroxymethyldihydropteridine diphosphokinase n=1 Tax=Psychrobacter TaxID=497 RepID=UPI001D108E8D|nr:MULTISPECIES: 2-amino-4-hydroxy-6-hydroxymethyldihydropteridine diphosphokinase [Psychrobacter]
MMHNMHKNLADLSLETLKKQTPEQLQTQSVTAVLLALGSNYQAKHYLPLVRKDLAALGEIQLSTAFENPDFTSTKAQPKPDYTNQCVYLRLTKPVTLQQLQQVFKDLEGDCHRQRLTEAQTPIKKVTMDIDILLIEKLLIEVVSDKNSLSSNKEFEESNWIVMADRYPFKAHERAGVEELIKGHFLKGHMKQPRCYSK